MDEIEDDSRYASKPYAMDHYNLLRRQKNSKGAASSRTTINRHEDDYDDDVLDEFSNGSDENIDCEDEDARKNGYDRNHEYDDHLDRHSRKRKVRNSVEGYEFVRRAIPREQNSSPEWTEHATFVLLEVWGDRFLQLGRKSLRSEDWTDVAEKVSEASKIERTETQCMTMLDTLKMKYKKEKMKVAETAFSCSRWPYFKKMDMLMASSSRKDCGLACGVDSGEFVFMNTKVYLDRSNGFDEMRDSPGESEVSEEDNEEDNDSDDLPPRTKMERDEEDSSLRVLADSIQKFGEIYEKIESSKREQMMELEKMRLDFHKDLEVQKKQILEKAQSEIARLQDEEEEDHEEEDVEEEEADDDAAADDADNGDDDEGFSDASKENFSG